MRKNAFLLQTVDLYEGANLSQVQVTLYELGSAARRKGLSEDKCIGAKTADVNIRHHDEQTLREGRNVIGLQVRFIQKKNCLGEFTPGQALGICD